MKSIFRFEPHLNEHPGERRGDQHGVASRFHPMEDAMREPRQLHLFDSNLGPRGRPLSFVPSGPSNALIFEFKELDRAKAFATVVKNQFRLSARVFDDAELAARAHQFFWVQFPPVVHVDRATQNLWNLGIRAYSVDHAWETAKVIEREIKELASKMGGDLIGP
jgi:hypothetical protein